MSRPLLALALAVQFAAAWLPLGWLLAQCGLADLAGALDVRTAGLLAHTLCVALGAAGLALALGLPLAYVLVRTRVPAAGLWRKLGLVPLLLPPLVLAISASVLVPLRGMPAAILVLGIGSFPLVLACGCDALERIDARRADAAQQCGGWRAVLASELPLLLPAGLIGACLAFTQAAGDFAVCDYISTVGPKLNVYSDEIFLRWSQAALASTPDAAAQRAVLGSAVASALVLLCTSGAALALCLWLQRRVHFVSQTSAFRRAEPLEWHAWRWPVAAALLATLGTLALAPLARLVFEAGGGSAPANALPGALASGNARGFQLATLGNSLALAFDRAGDDLANSVIFALGAAALCVPTAFVLAHAAQRSASRARGAALALAAFAPFAAPGTLFAMSAIALWNRAPTADFYASPWLPPLLFAGRFAPLAMLVLLQAHARVSPSLEEAGAVAGAGPATRLLRIAAPLVARGMLAGGLLVYTFSLRELDAAVLVPAANHTAIVRLYNGVHFARDSYVAALALWLCACILVPWLLVALRPSPARSA